MNKLILLCLTLLISFGVSAQLKMPYPEPALLPTNEDVQLWGYYNLDGEGKFVLVIDYQYEDAAGFSKSTSRARAKLGGKYGLITPDNFPVTGFMYDKMSETANEYGYYIVARDGKYGVIDGDGKPWVPCIYDSMYDQLDGWYFVSKDDQYGYVHHSGVYASSHSEYEKKKANLQE